MFAKFSLCVVGVVGTEQAMRGGAHRKTSTRAAVAVANDGTDEYEPSILKFVRFMAASSPLAPMIIQAATPQDAVVTPSQSQSQVEPGPVKAVDDAHAENEMQAVGETSTDFTRAGDPRTPVNIWPDLTYNL